MSALDKNRFGTYVKEKRLEKGYTQKALADLLMVDVTTVSKWERGVNYPDITMIPDLCRYLGVNEHELIESSNDTRYREIAAQADKFRKIKNSVFYTFSFCYAAAVIICLIVNICVEKRLSWFFPAAAGCICGFTFIPGCMRFFKKYNLCVYLGSTWLSLTLLFVSCSIYGRDYWFGVASSGVLLGYFSLFFPVLFSKQKKYLSEEKYSALKKYFCLIYSTGLMLLTLVVMISVKLYNNSHNLTSGIKIAGYCFILPVIWGITELLNLKRPVKTGIELIAAGIHFYGLNGVLNIILGSNGIDNYRIDFSNWNDCTNGNVAFVFFVVLCASGVAMIILSSVLNRQTHR